MKREKRRKAVLKKLERLAGGRVNDAVKLAFLDSDRMGEIDGLDLTAVSEFKRGGNGTVEVKLVDRVKVLEKLMSMLEDPDEGAEAFFRAMEGDGGTESEAETQTETEV